MTREYQYTRKHKGEEYKFYICKPSYKGEKGVCGIEITPYVEVITPPNDFGYNDIIFLNSNKKAYTLYRYIAPYILKAIEKQMLTLEKTL